MPKRGASSSASAASASRKRPRAGSSRSVSSSRVGSDNESGSGDESSDNEVREWKESQVKLREFYDQMSPEQLRRYEQFRRSCFDIDTVRNMMSNVLQGRSVDRRSGIVVSGSAKVYVGEIVELARTVMEERSESGPILPRHIREAARRLENCGKASFCKTRGSVLR